MAEQQVMTKDPKKVEAGKGLAEYNCRKREELKAQKSEVKPMLDSSTCYGIGAVLAVGVIGGLGYYAYQTKVNNVVPPSSLPIHAFRLISLKWSKFLPYYKMDKKSIVRQEEYSKTRAN